MKVSMLKGNGHPEAHLYPLCTLWTEVRIVDHRLNMMMVTNAILTQSAIDSTLLGKEGRKSFNALIKRLSNGP